MKAKLYFDIRKPNKAGQGQLYIILTKRGKQKHLPTKIYLTKDQWDNGKVVNHPNKKILNIVIENKLAEINKYILTAEFIETYDENTFDKTTDAIMEILDCDYKAIKEKKKRLKNSFGSFYLKFADTKTNKGTHDIYMCTYRKLTEYCKIINTPIEYLQFDEISKLWLVNFENHCLASESRNTASIHLRNIRAVFNAAIDEEICFNYPFRKFKIKHELSKDKSMTLLELKRFFKTKTNNEGEQMALDIFKLMFYLIGINGVDLFNAGKPVNGRLEYKRAKTKKMYSILIQPEAQEIIDKYKGIDTLLNLKDKVPNYHTLFNRLNKSLKKIGKTTVSGKKSEGQAMFPNICFGSARTSWATIAQEELDISRDIIAAALGHHTIDVTSTYLRTNWNKKIDETNRKIIDLITS